MSFEYQMDPVEYSDCDRCKDETPDYEFRYVFLDDAWVYICKACEILYSDDIEAYAIF